VRQALVFADPDTVRQLFALRDAVDARLVEALGELDHHAGYELDDATSLSSWMRNRAGRSPRDTAHLTRLTRRLHQLPELVAAWRDGRLTGGQIDVICGIVTDATIDQLAAQQADLIPALAELSVPDTTMVMRQWQRMADDAASHTDHDDDGPADEPAPEPSALYSSSTLGDRRILDGNLTADDGALVDAALRVATTRDGDDDNRTPAQRRADALVDICAFFLDNQQTKLGGRHRPHLNVMVDTDPAGHPVAGRYDNGTFLDQGTLQAMLCDCTLHRVMLKGGSSILDYGRAVRTFPANLWASLVIRDQHCRVPGCDAPPEQCDAHHVVPWERGGLTNLENGVLKCRRHHHQHHRTKGLTESLAPDGTYTICYPDGTTRTSRPPGTLTSALDLAA
jgi:hypothetical protein